MGNNCSVESPQSFLLPFLCGKQKYIENLEENLEALYKETQELNAVRNELLSMLSKVDDIRLQEVKGWISMVEEIEPVANRLIDQSVSEIQRLTNYGDCSFIPSSTYHYRDKVLKTLKSIKKALRSKGDFKDVNKASVIKMPPIQLTVSQQHLFERAFKFLEDKNVGILGIYGRDGVGKTTLLTEIKNKFVEAFDLVIFVVVNGFTEVESIQEELCKRLNLQWRREAKEEMRAEILMALKGNKYLLLLDGIEREVDILEEIGVPFRSRENGSKVVFTTRSREACDESSKWVDAQVELTCLSPEEAWDLFQEIVGDNTLTSHQDIPKLARVVASTCRGLPLALSVIGETMSRKTTVPEWRYTIHVLASSRAEFPDMEDGVLPILKSIYDNLSNEKIKLCFLYCALFPENCDIRKEDLVNYWIGEGILAKDDKEKAKIQGYELICDLVRIRLLMERGNGYCVMMHGMVREMALWIASDFGRQIEHFVVVSGERIHQLPIVNDWGKVRRMSVMSTQIHNISDAPSLQCSELTTLIFRRNRHLKQISGALFQWMTSLVVLDLSFNRELVELPEEVSCLVLLRFLNLSWTSIKALPLGLKELTSLIHLDLDYTSNLQDVDVIASLLNLQVLRLFQSIPLDLKLMEDIQLLKSLKELSLTVRGYSVLKRLLSIHHLVNSIQSLHLTETTIARGGILSLNSMLGLRDLVMFRCNIREFTIDWRTQFKNIHTVSIHECECVRELTWLVQAPNIRDLSLSQCPLLEEVISKEKAMAKMGETSEKRFKNLSKLVLDGLPKLKSIYWTPLRFPVLEYIEIRRCPELKRLPFNSESAIGNQVEVKIEKEWIKVVEWEDEATKQRFSLNNRESIEFPLMAEYPKLDATTSGESHPIQNIDHAGTTDAMSNKGRPLPKFGEWDVNDPASSARDEKKTGGKPGSPEILSSSTTNEPGQRLESPNLKDFSFHDLKLATRNFAPESLLGEGRFGNVYKGWMDTNTLAPCKPGSGMAVAIRKIDYRRPVQDLEYWQFLQSGMNSHPNLVKLLGYGYEGTALLVVSEFMPRGSLGDHLFHGKEPFPWDLRIKAMLGAARGLAFLHDLQRVHRDFKTTKILLDSNFEAKILDFSLPLPGEDSHISKQILRGTAGYAAPEYMETGQLYKKSNVYSFGVVLLEVMTGLPAYNAKPGRENRVEWLRPNLSKQIMDTKIKGEYTSKVATEMRRITRSCIKPDPKSRPDMKKVVEVLERIQQINVIPNVSLY